MVWNGEVGTFNTYRILDYYSLWSHMTFIYLHHQARIFSLGMAVLCFSHLRVIGLPVAELL